MENGSRPSISAFFANLSAPAFETQDLAVDTRAVVDSTTGTLIKSQRVLLHEYVPRTMVKHMVQQCATTPLS